MGDYFLQMMAMAASVVCALLFLVAGIDKLRHRALLPGVIANYRLLPPMLVAPAALLLPVAELAVAGGLLVQFAPWAPLAAIVLLLVFAVAMGINIARGRRHIDCGCGHKGLRQQLEWRQVVRNLLLASALVPAVVANGAPGLDSGDVALGYGAGVVVYLMMMLFAALRSLPGFNPVTARG